MTPWLLFEFAPRFMSAFLGGAILIVAFFLLLSGLLMWLWNITMPEIFRLPQIHYWQAFRLLLIAGLLFGGADFRSS